MSRSRDRHARPRGAGGLRAALLVIGVLAAAPIMLVAGGNGPLLPGTQPSNGTGDPAFPPFRDGALPGTFDRPGACDNCHSEYHAANEATYEPFETWAGSMMAQSARDPLFWAALDIANQDDAALGDVGVGDFCLRCHVPRAWYEGRSRCNTPWGEEFDGSCLEGDPSTPDNDFEGMLCSVCHRSYDASNPPAGQFADPNAPYAGNARLYLTTEERRVLGPFSDATPFGHDFEFSPFHRTSAFCGQCHDVTNPVRNRRDSTTGADLGYLMPIERTFTEHQQSRIGDPSAPEHQVCQACHMPPPDLDGDGVVDDAYACGQAPGLRGPATALEGPLHVHSFAGPSAWMLALLREEYGVALNRAAYFDLGIEASRKLMTERALQLDLTAPASADAGTSFAITARVTNLAGHKFPTGYPEGRRAWVNVIAGEDVDGDGALARSEVQWESASYDRATGVLVADAQAKVYEAKLGVFNHAGTGQCDLVDSATGKKMFHFVLNDCVVEDNRIPPLGFTPSVETAPVGYAYPNNPALPGTLANWDDTTLSIPVPLTATLPYLVEARVFYQSTSKEYVEFLRDESQSTCDPRDAGCDPTLPDARPNRGEKMHGLWERYDRAPPTEMEVARASLAIVPAPPGACCVLGACSERTPAECVAVEGAFSGPGTTCAAVPCPLPLPPGEPSNMAAGMAPLTVSRRGDGSLALTYDPACDASDHHVAWGPMDRVATYGSAGIACGLGVSGSATFHPGAGSWWFVVVGRSDVAEGSYGRSSRGIQRAPRIGAAACDLPQDLSSTCR